MPQQEGLFLLSSRPQDTPPREGPAPAGQAENKATGSSPHLPQARPLSSLIRPPFHSVLIILLLIIAQSQALDQNYGFCNSPKRITSGDIYDCPRAYVSVIYLLRELSGGPRSLDTSHFKGWLAEGTQGLA